MKRALVFVLLALAVFAVQSPIAQTQLPAGDFAPDEVLIEYRPGASDGQQAEARSLVGAVRRELHRRNRPGGLRNQGGDVELARVTGRPLAQVLAILRSHPAVRFAEPNWIYRKAETSNDPDYTSGDLWGMLGDATFGHTNVFGSQAGEAWEAGHVGSASIAVGIIDEGIQITHPDLAANIWTNPVEAAGMPGVDDDGNGYVDDIHGWDFFHNDNSVFDAADGDDHGTHVAGTIGAVGGNGAGVAGVNWHVTLVPAKFLGPAGGSTLAAIKALDYLVDLKTRHHLNIVATNNSWGGGGFSQALLNAIVRAAKADILFVAAAGNESNDNDAHAHYPSNYDTTAGAGYDAVIAVAAIGRTGAKPSFSNYGQTTVDLGAPGEGIVSTIPTSNYDPYNGTSMATPHVTGAAALYASLLPAVSARRIKEVILASATATPTASLATTTVTGGRLNIGEFAAAAPAAPSAPDNLTATAASAHQITLSWADNSTTEDGFQIERCQGAGCTVFTTLAYVNEDVVAFTDKGLTADTRYRYRVKAYNSGGGSAFATSEGATPPVPPPHADAGADLSVLEGASATLDGTQSSDPENEEIAFAWMQTAGPAVVLTGAGTGRPTFTAPSVGASGATLTFALSVTAAGRSATDSVDVVVLNVNAAPEITSAPPSMATEDVPYSYAAVASDEDGPGQAWSLLPANSCGGTIDAASGVFSFTAAGPVPPASCVLALQVCDGGEPNLCATQTASVTIDAVNDPPVITSAPPAAATEDAPYNYSATADDEDGPGRTWRLLPANTCGGTIDASSGAFAFTPAGPAPAASCVLAMQVCDGATINGCAAQTTTVTIAALNDPPVITSTPPAMATEDVVYHYAATADDEDGPGQLWSLLPANSCGGAIDAASGAFTFTPAGPVPPASCVLALQVCDGAAVSACATQTALISIAAVNDVPTFVPPTDIAAVATSGAGAAVSFTAMGSDPEDGPRAAVCTPASGATFPIGTTTVGCTVTDTAGATAAGSFTVTVTDLPVPGEMKGDGFIRDDEAKYIFSFLARERASGADRGRLSVRVDADGRTKKGKKRDDRFESRSVDFIQFSDDPAIRPGRSPKPQVDTVVFQGAGEWNGQPGYRYEVSAQDAGEPGRHRESISVTIRDAAGAIVASFAGELDGGNIRSTRIKH